MLKILTEEDLLSLEERDIAFGINLILTEE